MFKKFALLCLLKKHSLSYFPKILSKYEVFTQKHSKTALNKTSISFKKKLKLILIRAK